MTETDAGNYYAFFDKPVAENLAANRSGTLTPQQRVALERSISNHKGSIALVVGMIMCAALTVFFILWKADNEDGIRSFNDLIVTGGAVTLLLGVLAVLLTGDWFVFFVRDDMENGIIESAVGDVEWKWNRYGMQTDSRQLRSLRSGVRLPPPGHYRFYYLPRTGLVVMAEALRNEGADEHVPVLLLALASANNFSPNDLIQNHKGLLSTNQGNHLMLIVVFWGFTLLSSVVLFATLLPQVLHALSSTGFLVLLLMGAVLIVQFGRGTAQIIADLWSGEVMSVTGLVARQTHRTRYYRSYYYAIASHKFQISRAAYNALIEEKPYRIYYVPRSQRLVSIEPL